VRYRGVIIVEILSVVFSLFSLYLVLGRHSLLLRLIGAFFLALMMLFLYRTGVLRAIGVPYGG
jgi:hypothetical protein